MAIISIPILLQSMFLAAIADLRKNPFLIDDLYGGLAMDRLSSREYGYKELAAAKKWFLGTNIDVVMQFRVDQPRFPVIAIMRQGRSEMTGQRTNIGDDEAIETHFNPRDVATQPVMVYPPFTPAAYNPLTGQVTLPITLDGSPLNGDLLVAGQFYVSAKSGKAYQILSPNSDNQSFMISPNINDDFTGGYIVPPVSLWNLHKENTYARESFSIQCSAISEVSTAEWLHDLAWYILCRYKEAYIEGRGFELSTLSSGPMELDSRFTPQAVFTTNINFSGDNRISWIKFVAPKIQGVKAFVRIADGPATPAAYLAEVQQQSWQMENDPPNIPAGAKDLASIHAIGDDDIGHKADEENVETIGDYPDTEEDPTGNE